jgi:hypothetical protein
MHSDSTRSPVVLALPASYALIHVAATAGRDRWKQVTGEVDQFVSGYSRAAADSWWILSAHQSIWLGTGGRTLTPVATISDWSIFRIGQSSATGFFTIPSLRGLYKQLAKHHVVTGSTSEFLFLARQIHHTTTNFWSFYMKGREISTSHHLVYSRLLDVEMGYHQRYVFLDLG